MCLASHRVSLPALLSEVGRRAIDEPSSKEPEMRSSGFKLVRVACLCRVSFRLCLPLTLLA